MIWLFIIYLIIEYWYVLVIGLVIVLVIGLVVEIIDDSAHESIKDDDYYHRISLGELQTSEINEEVNHNEYNEVLPTNLNTDEEVQETRKSVKIEDVYVYLMKNNQNGYYKIGISNNCKYREKTLQSQEPDVCLVCSKKFTNRTAARQMETMLHRYYQNSHLRGEWYRLTREESKMVQNLLK